jgi:hypothetical protein
LLHALLLAQMFPMPLLLDLDPNISGKLSNSIGGLTTRYRTEYEMVDAYSLAFTTIGGAIHAIPTSPSFVSIESLSAANDAWVDKLLPQWVSQ